MTMGMFLHTGGLVVSIQEGIMLLVLEQRLRAGVLPLSTWHLVNGSPSQHKHMLSLPPVQVAQTQPCSSLALSHREVGLCSVKLLRQARP